MNSCTIEETLLQTSYECNISQGSNLFVGSGRSYYSEDDDDQKSVILDCSVSLLSELELNIESDDLAPDPSAKS